MERRGRVKDQQVNFDTDLVFEFFDLEKKVSRSRKHDYL